MKIKICGLQSLKDIAYVNESAPDFAGFILATNSKRKIDANLAIEMKKKLNPDIKSVGVFVDADIQFIKELCDKGVIDIIQLHGNENNDYIKGLKKITGKEIIKAYRADEELEKNIKESASDYVLIDSSSRNSFGGTGLTFDWNLIPKTDKKIFLAGGINIDNVADAIKKVKPFCLDINSGVETDGKKDGEKIRKITEIIKISAKFEKEIK